MSHTICEGISMKRLVEAALALKEYPIAVELLGDRYATTCTIPTEVCRLTFVKIVRLLNITLRNFIQRYKNCLMKQKVRNQILV